MSDSQRLQETRVSIRCVARYAGLEPVIEVSRAIDNPPSKFAIDRPVAVEPELSERAFGEPDVPGRVLRGNDLRQVWHVFSIHIQE